jgi:hypothetical protein
VTYNPRLQIQHQNGQTPPTVPLDRQAEALAAIHGAAILRECAGPTFKGTLQPIAFERYRERFLAASGNPTDPVEVMLVEQSLWAHFRLGQLHVNASGATGETIAVYNAAATRLMSECRKHVLALREYRSPVAPKQVTIFKQQNVAAGDQQIALVEGNGVASGRPSENNSDIELPSKGAIGHATHPVFLAHHAEPQTCFGRAPEPIEARPLNGRGSGKAPAIGSGP